MELTKKQIENILEWLGKSYPVDVVPPENIEIEVLTYDFKVIKTVCYKEHNKIKFFDVPTKTVFAWRHIKHGK